MTGNAYVFSTLAAAQACQAAVDAAIGYPKAGTDIGGGLHVTPGPFVTTTYFVPYANPASGTQWAYPADAVATPILSPQAMALSLPAPTTLNASWTPVVAGVA